MAPRIQGDPEMGHADPEDLVGFLPDPDPLRHRPEPGRPPAGGRVAGRGGQTLGPSSPTGAGDQLPLTITADDPGGLVAGG